MTARGARSAGRHRGRRRRARGNPSWWRSLRPWGGRPYRRRLGRHRPDARAGQGVGDPDLRHGRQAGAVDHRAGGDRRGRRSHGTGRRGGTVGQHRDRRLPVSRVARRCSHARARRGWTSCRRSGRDRLRRRGAAAAHLGTVHRRARGRPDDPDSPDRGRRLSLVTLGLSRRGRDQRRGRARVVAAPVLGVGDRDAFALPPSTSPPSRAADGATERRCAAVVRHPQRGLLPDRHRADRAAARAGGLVS